MQCEWVSTFNYNVYVAHKTSRSTVFNDYFYTALTDKNFFFLISIQFNIPPHKSHYCLLRYKFVKICCKQMCVSLSFWKTPSSVHSTKCKCVFFLVDIVMTDLFLIFANCYRFYSYKFLLGILWKYCKSAESVIGKLKN